MNKSIFKTAVAVAGAAVFFIGCGDKSVNVGDGDIVGDWLVTEMTFEEDGESWVEKAPNNEKNFVTFTSSGDFIQTGFEKFGNFWIESIESGWKYRIDGNSLCIDYKDDSGRESCDNYSVSGNTFTVTTVYSDYSETIKAVRADIANTKSSLSKVYGQDPALYDTEWTRPSESGGGRVELSSTGYYEYPDVYISDYYGYAVWYIEDSRLTLVILDCDSENDDENCYVDKTVTLDYQLSGNTLRLHPTGTSDWDVWTLRDKSDYMYKSNAESKKGKRPITPFQAFRR